MSDDVRRVDTFCAQCGPSVDVDEDGCCITCGATAIGEGVEWIERLRAEVERVREQRNALSIRLHEYAGEVSRAIYPAISTIRKDIARRALDGEEKYPCIDCGVLRTKAEGGTTFTVCDECWDKRRALDGEE